MFRLKFSLFVMMASMLVACKSSPKSKETDSVLLPETRVHVSAADTSAIVIDEATRSRILQRRKEDSIRRQYILAHLPKTSDEAQRLAEEEMERHRLSIAELRACGDPFFQGRGDTLYLLFNPTDTLQYLRGDTLFWHLRPFTADEQAAIRCELSSISNSPLRCIPPKWYGGIPDFSPSSCPDGVEIERVFVAPVVWLADVGPASLVAASFAGEHDAVSRGELAAFHDRYHRWAKAMHDLSGNFFYFYTWGSGPWQFFRACYLLVPDGDGYQLRPLSPFHLYL